MMARTFKVFRWRADERRAERIWMGEAKNAPAALLAAWDALGLRSNAEQKVTFARVAGERDDPEMWPAPVEEADDGQPL